MYVKMSPSPHVQVDSWDLAFVHVPTIQASYSQHTYLISCTRILQHLAGRVLRNAAALTT